MKKETNRKRSPNRIKCQVSGIERMSNKTYLANKGAKYDVTGNVWASFYVSKDEYKKLVSVVEEIGFSAAADQYKIDKGRLSKWIKFNGRGKFVAQKKEAVVA